MTSAEEHLRELLRLSARERARAARLLLESLDEPDPFVDRPNPFAEGTDIEQMPGSSADRGKLEPDDELAELDELATDKDGLRAAVRAAVVAELEPLHELTSLLRRFAELARTTGHTLRARET